jgi:hypothetical protein
VKLAIRDAGALQYAHEVGHVAVELHQPLAESGFGLEVFVTDKVVSSGQAGLREREPIRPEDVTIEEQRDTVDELILPDPHGRRVVSGRTRLRGWQ